MSPTEPLHGTEIAIVGMVGRFPGARNLDEFWRNLRDGVESIHFPDDAELETLGVDPSIWCAIRIRLWILSCAFASIGFSGQICSKKPK